MRARCLQFVLLLTSVCCGSLSCGDGTPTEPTPVCSYAISPAGLTFPGEGGAGSVAVTVGSACTWSATASAAWMAVTAGGTGSGPGTVAYSVAANPATESRSGTLMIAGQSHAVTQEGRRATVCSYELSPGSAEFGKDASTGTFAVSAPSDCTWAATSTASWLVVTPGNQSSGSGTVSYTVLRNSDVVERTATVTVADKAFTVRQSGDIGGCRYLCCAGDFDTLHAGRQFDSHSHDAGRLSMDGCAERALAQHSERII